MNDDKYNKLVAIEYIKQASDLLKYEQLEISQLLLELSKTLIDNFDLTLDINDTENILTNISSNNE